MIGESPAPVIIVSQNEYSDESTRRWPANVRSVFGRRGRGAAAWLSTVLPPDACPGATPQALGKAGTEFEEMVCTSGIGSASAGSQLVGQGRADRGKNRKGLELCAARAQTGR